MPMNYRVIPATSWALGSSTGSCSALNAGGTAMTITLNLKPEVEAGLLVQAQARGVNLEDYLVTLVEALALPAAVDKNDALHLEREDAVRKMIEFGVRHQLRLDQPITRASLHEGHRY
jgi:hypothetical protein